MSRPLNRLILLSQLGFSDTVLYKCKRAGNLVGQENCKDTYRYKHQRININQGIDKKADFTLIIRFIPIIG
ncbi:hypothetical protein D3C86_796260 [compost metagenome]